VGHRVACALALLVVLGAGCSEVKSITGIDEEEKGNQPGTVTVSADSVKLGAGETTTVRVKVTQKDGNPVKDGTQVQLAATAGALDATQVGTRNGGSAAVTYRAPLTPGPDKVTAKVGDAGGELTLTVDAAAPAAPPAPAPPPPGASGGPGGFDLASVTWLDPNVSSWPETSRITSTSIGDPPICINHTKAGQWPVVDGLEGNPWVFVNLNGRWYAATYEWLSPGQTCKGIHAGNIGEHVGRAPLSSWRPRSGELIGLMVSARARFRADTVSERSNIVFVRWP
jgi:hypothetical protein